ncbi:TNF receptor-associated factor 6-like [Amblyomma americanum]
MPPSSTSHTLVGFWAELDWRPLHFLKPIPGNRVCSACGLVRRMNALLPCMHVLCHSCFEQCAAEGSRCPLDGDRFMEEDIDWTRWPADEVLEREVKCWNAKHGCGTVVAASQLPQHFQRDCRYHSARCPKCSVSVLCSDVCAHLRSDCATPSTDLAPDSGHQKSNTDDAAPSTSFQRVIEKQAVEMRTNREHLISDAQCHGDRLIEMSQGINTFKEVISVELMQATRLIQDSLTANTLENTLKDGLVNVLRQSSGNCSQILASIQEMKRETLQNSDKTLDGIETLLRRYELRTEHTIFDIKGVNSLEEKALTQSWAEYVSDQVYLCGYCISPGVFFSKDGETVHMHVRMLLHKGDNDDAVEWPFQHKIRMGILHPQEEAMRVVEIKPRLESEPVQKPRASTNTGVVFDDPSFTLHTLRLRGFVFEDTLRIKWEVLP